MTEAGWNRSINALIVCVFCGAAAALVGVTALGVQIYELTHREIDLGLLGLAEFAPAALLVLATGSVADRFDRTRVTSIGAAAEAIAGLGLAAYAATGPTSVLPIFGLVLVFGAGRAFMAPALRALPADIVSAERLPWLTSRRAVAWQVAIIVGPVISGFLYAVDPVAPYLAMAAFAGIASVSVIFVDPQRQAPRTIDAEAAAMEASVDPVGAAPVAAGRLREALEGLRFIRRSPILLGAISLDLFAVLFGGAVALLPAIASDRLGVGAVGLGWLRAAGGIGAAVVTLGIARRQITRRVGRVLLLSVSVFGIATIVLGLSRSYAIAFIAMAVLSGADSISVFIRSTLVPLATPHDKRGRVLAVESVFIGASNELGAFESGVAGQLLGASGAVVLGGAATILVAGYYWARFPALRNVDHFPNTAQS
ncbi:MAG: MFS transporter [Actinomycetota bacterium]